ncbi:transglycosylase [Aeromicrobium marinum DSM 15272]|uniref:Transglycosylase n=1 Tax=Aeromicrobium marinum DSM 15272 TaxID=585531 RepID=E2SC82_9ACTN|nr:transglycosylase domain-containing protein [Aeromicrobium marinum]EFQ83368.1 transglycosylase [Aeromicrobium marinum DSM 15272]
MSWDDLQSAVRRRVQAEDRRQSTPSLVASIARLSVIGGVLVAAIIVPVTAIVAVTATQASTEVIDLPLTLEEQPTPQTSRLLAADGQLLAYFYEENRQDVPLDEIAPVMQDAIISIEDERFYDHGALDIQGTLRALVNNASDGRTQGGSTITQQLVKLTLVQAAATDEERRAAVEQSVARKVRELKIAIDFEEQYTKDEILERYLNIAYYGGGAYGISAAANHFFSVSPADLTLAQAATLAGLVKNPVEFDPNVYPERALQRRNLVLSVMERQGKISPEESEQLQAGELALVTTDFPNGCITSVASFSCDYVQRYLENEEALGATVEERRDRIRLGGLTIKSNIDVSMQTAVNDAVAGNVLPTDQAIGSIALVEPGTGKVRGMAQSRPMGTDREGGQSFINFSVPTELGDSGGFQAGSTFKMFTTAAALQQGIGVDKTYNSPPRMTIPRGTYFDCEGGGTDRFEVRNSTSSGTMNMYTALRQSVNTYFAQLEAEVGLCETVRMAEAMGIEVPFGGPDNGVVPSFTLGPIRVSTLDMAAAYAVPASGGMFCEPQPVTEILEADGSLLKAYVPECERVLTNEEAAQINDILRGLQQPGGFGFSNGTGLNIPSAAKTGTTNDNKAVWYTGYTPEISAAAMIAGADFDGFEIPLSGQRINGRFVNASAAAGSALAGPMWADAMQVIQNSLSPVNFERPPRTQPAPPRPPEPEPDPNAPAPPQQTLQLPPGVQLPPGFQLPPGVTIVQ